MGLTRDLQITMTLSKRNIELEIEQYFNFFNYLLAQNSTQTITITQVNFVISLMSQSPNKQLTVIFLTEHTIIQWLKHLV